MGLYPKALTEYAAIPGVVRGFGSKVFFVDSTNGDDDNAGTTWQSPMQTIAAAVAACAAGDSILLKGSFNEAVTCDKIGVRFIGIGTGPAQATWTAPTVAGSWCLKIAAASVLVENIKFKPVIYTSSGVPSGIYLSGANYAVIRNCRFQGQTGSRKAIYSPVCDSDNVLIEGCEFIYMNTATHGAAIFGVEAGGLSYSGWIIRDCIFNSCLADIDICGRVCLLEGNKHFISGITAAGAVDTVTVQAVDLSGTGSGSNVMTKCTLGGTYNLATYKPGASGDVWMGNYCSIVATVAPNGVSVLIPAA